MPSSPLFIVDLFTIHTPAPGLFCHALFLCYSSHWSCYASLHTSGNLSFTCRKIIFLSFPLLLAKTGMWYMSSRGTIIYDLIKLKNPVTAHSGIASRCNSDLQILFTSWERHYVRHSLDGKHSSGGWCWIITDSICKNGTVRANAKMRKNLFMKQVMRLSYMA